MAIGKSINFSGSPVYKNTHISQQCCVNTLISYNAVSHYGSEVMALLPKSVEKSPILPVLYSLSGIHKPIIMMISVLARSIRLKVLTIAVIYQERLGCAIPTSLAV